MRVGGYGKEKEATDEVITLVAPHKAAAEAQLGRSFADWTPVLFTSQVVAGTNFRVKVAVGGDEHVHLTLFCPLPHTGQPSELVGCKAGFSATAPLSG